MWTKNRPLRKFLIFRMHIATPSLKAVYGCYWIKAGCHSRKSYNKNRLMKQLLLFTAFKTKKNLNTWELITKMKISVIIVLYFFILFSCWSRKVSTQFFFKMTYEQFLKTSPTLLKLQIPFWMCPIFTHLSWFLSKSAPRFWLPLKSALKTQIWQFSFLNK